MASESVSEDAAPLPRVVSRVATTISTAQAVHSIVKAARARWIERTEYITTISSLDDSYRHVMCAVLASVQFSDQRAVQMVTRDNHGPVSPAHDGSSNETTDAVTWSYDGTKTLYLPICGHRIKVSLTDERFERRGDFDQTRRSIKFESPTMAARDALHAWLTKIVARVRQTVPMMRIASKWGSWEYVNDVPSRDIDTVILADDVRETAMADLDRFIRAEATYARLGTPWHRGYLFHGPPGTGKTSFARALASHYGLNLYYVPLGDMNSDVNLITLIANIPARSVLLLEDIDIYSAATRRDDDTSGATLSGVLNTLDGVFTPHGLVTILTTNHRDQLDGALIRPGRIDCEIEFASATYDQVERIWRLAFPDLDVVPELPGHLVGESPARIIGTLQRYLDDPAAALVALKDLLSLNDRIS